MLFVVECDLEEPYKHRSGQDGTVGECPGSKTRLPWIKSQAHHSVAV